MQNGRARLRGQGVKPSVEFGTDIRYLGPMNKPSTSNPIPDWTDAPAVPATQALGYDAWLAADIAAGQADLDAGRTTPLALLRKDLGLE